MISEVQRAFLTARTLLPSPSKAKTDVMVIATGHQPAMWTPHYIPTAGEPRHFIFVREIWRNRWICLDKMLQDWLELSNKMALRLLEEAEF